MASDSVYYKHSGHIGFVGPILMIIFGLVSSVVLGLVYGYLILYNPFIFINFLATIIYGGLCGGAMSYAAKVSKVRNEGFVLLCGLAVGALCIYTGWVSWLYAFSEETYFAPTGREGIFSVLGSVAGQGAWSMFGWTPTGGTLYAIWAIEAVMIAVGAVGGSYVFIDESENTFCDNCRKWAKDVYTSPLLTDIKNPAEFKARLERAEYQPLHDLEHGGAVAAPGSYTRLVVQGCRKCWAFFCLDVKQVELSKDDKGQRTEGETLLIDNLLIGPRLHDKIKQRFGEAL